MIREMTLKGYQIRNLTQWTKFKPIQLNEIFHCLQRWP